MVDREQGLRGIWIRVFAVTLGAMAAGAGSMAPPPDLTRGDTVDRSLTYNLGATGLRGWIHTKAATFLDSQQGRTTTASRQILVTHVGAGSPADGQIQVGDVILGTGGGLFTQDARKSLALAIQEAEKEERGGHLKLARWRAGRSEDVTLNLRVLGTYSATAPWDCPKSDRILKDACRMLEREPLTEDLWGAVNGLALMATGDPAYLPKVAALARKLGPPTLKLEFRAGMVTWDWAYRDLFLCEYHLLTGDTDVLPAIREYTVSLARGQSLYGTMGHGVSGLTAEGGLHGSVPSYGPVNAAGLVANLAIVMGRKCGVRDPEIDPAIERGSRFFAYYVDKGSIPYGEHLPWPNHDNNGKNAMAAVFFGIQGDHRTEAQYFSKMVTASYWNREYGHTGQGFSYLWGALGANVGGAAAAAAFLQEASWHLDLVRRCDGSFTYDGGEQYGPGKTEDDTYYGRSGYYGLSPTASYVLTYALPRKKLFLTGRGAKASDWLPTEEVRQAIVSGRFDLDRDGMGTDGLLTRLGDWSPVVRGWAAEELGRRWEGKGMVGRLVLMAEGPDAWTRQGATEALGYLGTADVLPVLVRLLTHEDRWLRVKAAQALGRLGQTARPAIPDMLRALVVTAEPLTPIGWKDPVQLTQGELAAAVFRGLLQTSIEGVDPALLYPAIRAVVRNADGMARGYLAGTFTELLSQEDVVALAPDILTAIEVPAPADTMFANEIRMAGLRVLAKYRFREAIPAAVKFARNQSPHGSEKRMGEILDELLRYGTAARDTLPDLRRLLVQCREEQDFPDWAKKLKVASVEKAIAGLESATQAPETRSTGTARGASIP